MVASLLPPKIHDIHDKKVDEHEGGVYSIILAHVLKIIVRGKIYQRKILWSEIALLYSISVKSIMNLF